MMSAQTLDRIRQSVETTPELNVFGDPWDTVYTAKIQRAPGTFVSGSFWFGGRVADLIQYRDVATGEGFMCEAGQVVEIDSTGEILTPAQAGLNPKTEWTPITPRRRWKKKGKR
jgi:hypothetical protein